MSKDIDSFLDNNKSVKKKEETDHINFETLWGDDTFMCRFEKTSDFSSLANIELPNEFSAIFHKDKSCLEFIYSVILNTEATTNRKFKFHFEGLEFKAYFDKPSDSLNFLTSGFRATGVPSDTNYRNLRMFYDYGKINQSDGLKKFFGDKVPTSFFVRGDFAKIQFDFIKLAKHLNFYMRYFDRTTPVILIFNTDKEKEKFVLPCHTETKQYPETINARKVEPVILDLLQVASETNNIRLKYIFYYQILEYCSYYHLNEELKRRLNNIVKNPDVLNNSGHYSRQIIEEFKNYFKTNDDKQKLEKLVLDYCEYDDIKLEVKCNSKYFCQEVIFDGGFKLPGLIKNEEEADDPSKEIIKNIVDKIDKIRNVLVHIRESRENRVILPTKNNNHQLVPYLYLIRRIAEIVAIKYE
jgi:hypothetical protein